MTWTVTDASGNTATCSFDVTVNDTENPTITCVGNQVRNTDAGVCSYTAVGTEFDPTAFADNCTGSTISNDFNSGSTLAGAIFPKGTTTVTWTVTDASGNTATCSFDVTVNDTENPTITCVANQTRNTNAGVCSYTAVGTEFDPTAFTDNCPGSTISNDYNSASTLAGAIFPKGTTTVTWTVTDASGNTATCSFTVTVNDNENPTITCVANQTRSTDPGVCSYTAVGSEFDPTAFGDNCPGSVIINDYNSGSTLAGAIFPKGTTTVTWTVTDASGLTATCSFDVTVNDTENPTITCVGNQARNTNVAVCTYTVVGTEFDPTASGDNCTGTTITNSYNNGTTLAGAIFPLGSTVVTWTITDAAGNTATCSFTVTVTEAAPIVDAGPDGYTCQGNPFTVTGASAGNYLTLIWTTNGLGTLTNATTLTPTYTPTASETGNVTLTLTINPNAQCGMASDSMILHITPGPTGDAGPDATTCDGQPYTVSGAWANNYANLLWVSTGQGTLTDYNSLTPTYTPAPGETGTIMLTMIIYGLNPCGQVSSSMNLTISTAPSAYAGPDTLNCGTTPFLITESSASGYTSIQWSTSGTGTFDNVTLLHPTYTPSAADVLAGNIFLTLTAYGTGSCPSQEDAMKLTFTLAPVANAGADIYTCENTPVTVTDASAANYSSILWTHSGTGVLTNETTLSPTYTPASGETGEITLTLSVSGEFPCPATSDLKKLTISLPVIATAGPDAAVCEGQTFDITGASAQNYADVLWTTTGSGTFNDHLLVNPIYTPGASDIEAGQVKLIFTVTPLGGCLPVVDTLLLTINKIPVVYAGDDQDVCPGPGILMLNASAFNYDSLRWSSSFPVIFSDPQALNSTVTIPYSLSGNVVLNLTVYGLGACSSQVVTDNVTLSIKQHPIVNAGPDQIIEQNSATKLSGSATGGSGAYAYSWQPADLLADPLIANPQTVLLNNNVTFILTVLDLVTGCYVPDSMKVTLAGINVAPLAVDDYDTTTMNIPIIIAFLANDFNPYPGLLDYTILEGPKNGTVEPYTDSLLIYTPNNLFVGDDSITYVIYDNDLIPQTDTAVIYIHVGDKIPLEIYNVITPNGDGMNDKWVIGGLEEFPNNEVLIFNRWGDKIHYYENYNNSNIVWDGTDKHGNRVPDGTYFYIIKIQDIGNYNGWIYVRANGN